MAPPTSPVEDSVDRYNHTWLVSFLLALAAFTLLIPYIFDMPDRSVPSSDNFKLTVKCWCPAEFTNNMVEFTNAECGAAFQKAQAGSQAGTDSNGASLYRIPNQLIGDQNEIYTPEILAESNSTEVFMQQSVRGALDMLVGYTPLFLFVCAAILKCVHVLYLLYVSWYGVNASNLILSWKSVSLISEQNELARKEFVQELASRFQSARQLAKGYIVYKFLIFTVCFVIAMLIYIFPVPESPEAVAQSVNGQSSGFKSVMLICSLTVRALQRNSVYMTQCTFIESPSAFDDQSTQFREEQLLSLYRSFFSALLFAFVLITTVNAVNLFLWIVKLYRGKPAGRSNKRLSPDSRLLVCLTEEHLDFTASNKLEKLLVQDQKDSAPDEELTKTSADIV
uniref:Innexin n=1 Tax=Biomphalaria glabrata TaxID=6526 RepID=A0A2C9KRZ6_BIOGL